MQGDQPLVSWTQGSVWGRGMETETELDFPCLLEMSKYTIQVRKSADKKKPDRDNVSKLISVLNYHRI